MAAGYCHDVSAEEQQYLSCVRTSTDEHMTMLGSFTAGQIAEVSVKDCSHELRRYEQTYDDCISNEYLISQSHPKISLYQSVHAAMEQEKKLEVQGIKESLSILQRKK